MDIIGFTTLSPDPQNFLLNNFDALESYYLYFKDRAHNIISQFSRDPLIYDNHAQVNHVNEISMNPATINNRDEVTQIFWHNKLMLA